MALQGFPHVLPESVEKPGHALTRSIDSRASPRRVPTKESIPQPSLLSFAFVRLQRRVENETLPAPDCRIHPHGATAAPLEAPAVLVVHLYEQRKHSKQ